MHLIRLALIGSTLLLTTPAMADAPSLQGSYGDWRVYARYDGAQRLCYVVSDAKSKSPTTVNHGDIHFLVANWKSGAAFEQPSFMAGFNLKKSQPPTIRIGNSKTPMFVAQNEGFVSDRADEVKLIDKMRAGSFMKVDAVSVRGTKVSYSFSLKGITAALTKASASCQ